jgi:hypothetical protein
MFIICISQKEIILYGIKQLQASEEFRGFGAKEENKRPEGLLLIAMS